MAAEYRITYSSYDTVCPYLTDVETTTENCSFKHIPWKLHPLREHCHLINSKLSVLQPYRNSWGGGSEGGRERGREGGGREGGRE